MARRYMLQLRSLPQWNILSAEVYLHSPPPLFFSFGNFWELLFIVDSSLEHSMPVHITLQQAIKLAYKAFPLSCRIPDQLNRILKLRNIYFEKLEIVLPIKSISCSLIKAALGTQNFKVKQILNCISSSPPAERKTCGL